MKTTEFLIKIGEADKGYMHLSGFPGLISCQQKSLSLFDYAYKIFDINSRLGVWVFRLLRYILLTRLAKEQHLPDTPFSEVTSQCNEPGLLEETDQYSPNTGSSLLSFHYLEAIDESLPFLRLFLSFVKESFSFE